MTMCVVTRNIKSWNGLNWQDDTCVYVEGGRGGKREIVAIQRAVRRSDFPRACGHIFWLDN